MDEHLFPVIEYSHRQTDDKIRRMMDGGMKMMVNNANNNQSGYRSLNQHVNMALSGECARNVNHPSGAAGRGGRAYPSNPPVRRQREALEETLHQADQLRKKTAEEAAAKYGESVDKSLAARIMGVTRSTVYAMIVDGRVESRRAQARERAQHCGAPFYKTASHKKSG